MTIEELIMLKNTSSRLCLSTFLWLGISTHTFASERQQADYQPALAVVKKQLKEINWHSLNDSENWAYTVETRLDNGNTGPEIQQTKQRFDPSYPLSQQWQLLEAGFAKPTKARLEQHKMTMQEISKDNSPTPIGEVDIVDLSTLLPLDSNADQAQFSFNPRLMMFDEHINQLFEGILIFDNKKQHITYLHIKSKESFSPKLSFTVESYSLNIKIAKDNEELHVVNIQSEKSGSAFYFKNFDEKSVRSFSQFERVN